MRSKLASLLGESSRQLEPRDKAGKSISTYVFTIIDGKGTFSTVVHVILLTEIIVLLQFLSCFPDIVGEISQSAIEIKG